MRLIKIYQVKESFPDQRFHVSLEHVEEGWRD